MKTFTHNPVALKYGDLICETTEKGRVYVTPEGKKYPSITTVLSILGEDHIREWRQRVGAEEANKVARRAAGRGTHVHSYVEKLLKNETLDISKLMPNIQASFRSLIPVLETRVDNIRLQEKPLYSDHLGLGGRVDLIAEYDGVLSIIDIKTSNRVKKAEDIEAYFIQESAYAIMFEERTGIPITSLVTIMAVDSSTPIIFREHRDNWTKKLLDVIKEHRRRRLFGHA